MFTLDQIKAAHAKVKSGADFPAYVQELIVLGVTHYEAYVKDGHTDYHGANNHTVTVPAKYPDKTIDSILHKENFIAGLKAHQRGETDYLTFISMCAEEGIEKWKIVMDAMTCTYYDVVGNEVLVEEIPR